MKIKKKKLLLIAAIIWCIAGFNILKIGIDAYSKYFNAINIIISLIVFGIFQYFVFGKLVIKHTKRIMTYEDEYQLFIKFFDIPSFVIMGIMITGGILLRTSGIVPEIFIAIFYSGLGASLLLAGILFCINFLKLKEEKIENL